MASAYCLHAEYPTESDDMTEYVCVRRDWSSGRQGGGLACYVRQDLPFIRMKELEKPDLKSLRLVPVIADASMALHIGVGVIYKLPGLSQ